ncbi:helix-turn-helix transcriptional regulator [Jatrophihabitans telluris]|uniref:Helix-turn-helix transcriptional regulator n=1 Tax=Jatrophihabitans telluris TaxID=2038343 RepID=A0ABY4QVR9_9ACTN|nr:helix-turn-helix transcriptional regulator [Jatrophihabitans telluris]UQX87595.1 helix-turn-helix transcriptional regulator [Jatrophihabitans telluris]
MPRQKRADLMSTGPDASMGRDWIGGDWANIVELIADGTMTATLRVPSGRDVVLLAGEEYRRLTEDRRESLDVRTPHLSAREKSVLAMIGVGHSGSSIAEELGLAVNTVAQHLASARRKLGVRSSNDAVVVARRHGLLD